MNPENTAAEQIAMPSPDLNSKSALVLVVDDDRIQRLLARKAIEHCGLRVEEATDGASALAALERVRPDIVLLDVMMPGMDGFEACTRLRALAGGASLPVLIMTALNDAPSIERAYECGATDFITKPISWAILGHRLRYMLRAAQVVEELAHSNEKLHTAQDQLLQSEKMASIGQLAAGVAHEINNPIGYVYSNLHALETYVEKVFQVIAAYEQAEASIADAATISNIEQVKRSADLAFLKEDVVALMGESREGITRVKKIVQDLKDFSHVGAEDEWQWADLHQGLDSTLNVAGSEIKYKAHVIRDYGDLPKIECVPSQLNQVFLNLLVNAAHAIEEQGTISVHSGVQGSEVWVEISDTGMGIAPENLARIFDPFFTTKPIGKGTGLGLSLSYGIVQKHHGRIEVRSEPARGTTFRVWLPIRRAATMPALEAA